MKEIKPTKNYRKIVEIIENARDTKRAYMVKRLIVEMFFSVRLTNIKNTLNFIIADTISNLSDTEREVIDRCVDLISKYIRDDVNSVLNETLDEAKGDAFIPLFSLAIVVSNIIDEVTDILLQRTVDEYNAIIDLISNSNEKNIKK